ncbi:MAG: hypothetical protein VKI63_08795 [Cyanobium sp.]|nr:hypothetical protein [Cyanobium sp.]
MASSSPPSPLPVPGPASDPAALSAPGFHLRCTLTFGDIYAQILIWMAVIFVSLAAGLALMGTSKPLVALVGVGLILVLSLPFLLFAFTTTLLNHIVLDARRETA